MSNAQNAGAKLPRRHYHGPRLCEKTCTVVGKSLPGHTLTQVARLLAPSASETREMLLKLRKDFQLSRGELAGFLAASEPALKAWERDKRSPSKVARRLIWLMDRFMRNNACLTFADLILWKRRTVLAEVDYQI